MPALSGQDEELTMKKAWLVLAFALAGCAGTRATVQSADFLTGNWVGAGDRDGCQRRASLMVDETLQFREPTGP